MADLQATVEHALRDAVRAALGAEHADTDPLVRPATDPKFGDFQANLAMPLAKTLKQKPRDIAERIREPLAQNDLFDHVDIAGPGFINMTLSPVALQQHTAAMLADARLGLPEAEPETVVVDYSGPNVAKEMHVGHLRPTNIGDALVRVLEFAGHHVIRQNHLGDWGTQFGRVMLGLWYEAVALKKGEQDRLERWIREVANLPKKSPDESSDEERARRTAEDELLSEIVPWHVAAYEEDPKGDTYFIPYIKESFPNLDRLQVLYTFATSLTDLESAKERIIPNRQYGERPLAALPSLIATFVQNPDIQDNEQERIAWEKCVDVTVNACQRIYDRLDVLLKPDDVRGESFYNDKLQPLVADLEKAGLLQESRGARVVFPEGFKDREGEPAAMIVQKSDGGYLYATTDLAAARFRIDELNADRLIYVTDARQAQHFAMIFQTLREASWAKDVRLDHVPFGAVLGPDRKPFKTRSGEPVRLRDLLDEAESRAAAIIKEKDPDLPPDERAQVAHAVGIGALKYADLATDRVKDYVFEWDRMLAFDGNTAPYLQYSYTRIRSIFRKGEVDPEAIPTDAVQVTEPAERALVLKLSQWAPTIAAVADSLQPHRLCNFLYELATAYHQFYEQCPVLTAPDAATKRSRLALCHLVARALKQGLELLGIDVVEKM